MRISHLIVAVIFGVMCVPLRSQQQSGETSVPLASQQQSGETSVGSGTPSLNVYRVGGRVSAPQVIKAFDAKYTEEARQHKIKGTVRLWVIIGPDGLLKNIRVVRSPGYGLDEEAIKTVKEWKFKPAKLKGQPVAVQINIEMNFTQ